MSAVLEATGVTLRYGAVTAVDDVDIAVEPGMLHGVIGPNGAGKSSFMDALSGRRKLSGGTVVLDGQDITKKPVAWRRLNGMARSFQRTSVFNSMTVRAQLEMVARKTKEQDLDSVIDALDLGPYLDKPCNSISYGLQRSVDIGDGARRQAARGAARRARRRPLAGGVGADARSHPLAVHGAQRRGRARRARRRRRLPRLRQGHGARRSARCWPPATRRRSAPTSAWSRPTWGAEDERAAGAQGRPRLLRGRARPRRRQLQDRRRRDRRPDRPQRRRQDHDAAVDLPRADGARRDPRRRQAARQAPLRAREPRRQPRAAGQAASSRTSRSRRTSSSGARRGRKGDWTVAEAARAVPEPGARVGPPGQPAQRRRAADARDRAGADGRARRCCCSTSRPRASPR